MGKQWVRQQVKHNELQEALERSVLWVMANRQQASLGALLILLAGVAAGGVFYRSRSRQTAAWDQLSLAQGLAYGGRSEASLEQLRDLASRYQDTKASGLGLLLAGDILYPRGQYQQALEHYAKVLERGEPKILVPLALGDTAVSQEAAGQYQEAILTSQRFLEAYPDHFLAPQVHACLARCLQALGQAEKAQAAYQKIALQYPDTSWAGWAQARLKAGSQASLAAPP